MDGEFVEMIEIYVKLFGISDLDINEAPWLSEWIARHHNNLRYDYLNFKFVWIN